MAEDRIKALLAIAETQPEEVMIWYGLANEYVKLERWQEAVMLYAAPWRSTLNTLPHIKCSARR